MKQLLLTTLFFSFFVAYSQELSFQPASIRFETDYDFKADQYVVKGNTKIDFELNESVNENLYYQIANIDSLIDNNRKHYLAKPPAVSYDNRTNLMQIEFDSLNRYATSISVYGKMNILDRTNKSNKIVVKYSPKNFNRRIYTSKDDELIIYLLNLDHLQNMENSDLKEFKKIMNEFKETNIFSQSTSEFSYDNVRNEIGSSTTEDINLVFYVLDKKRTVIKINTLDSEGNIVNYGFTQREAYQPNSSFVTLFNIQNDNKDVSSIEILTSNNLVPISFKIEQIKIP